MSSKNFLIKEHMIPASFVRGFCRGVRDETSAQLRMCVKQYKPIHYPEPRLHDPSIIFTHGTSIAKESCEPMFDATLSDTEFRIRSIWSIEYTHHGTSYLLNKDILGDEIHWFDHSRDIIHTIDHFQADM